MAIVEDLMWKITLFNKIIGKSIDCEDILEPEMDMERWNGATDLYNDRHGGIELTRMMLSFLR